MNINSPFHMLVSILHSCGMTHKELTQCITPNNIQNIFDDFMNQKFPLTGILADKKINKIQTLIQKSNIDKRIQFFEENAIKIYTIFDEDFPSELRNIAQIPFIIYTKGNISLQKIRLGIVGSRKSTSYGESALNTILSDNIPQNVTIISGGAYGIDTLAHQIALKKNLHTIAVFGCGIDVFYPKQNTQLFEQIIKQNGGIISMFPIGARPEQYHFPLRNEIVAGLSDAILIPEAGIKSGTLITARLALDLGKDVFAIPGDIFRQTSEGCNLLIKQGEAQCVTSAEDIFWKESPEPPYQIPKQTSLTKHFDNPTTQSIFESIQSGNNTIDLLIQQTNLSIETISMEIAMLEINGDIRCGSTGNYECIF